MPQIKDFDFTTAEGRAEYYEAVKEFLANKDFDFTTAEGRAEYHETVKEFFVNKEEL